MNPDTQNAKVDMRVQGDPKRFSRHARPTRLALAATAALTMLAVVALVSVKAPSAAAQSNALFSAPITLASLQGPWALSLVGNTGCGIHSMYVTLNLNASGVDNNATIQSSSTGCPPGTTTGLTFDVLSLNPDGSGTAGLSCGPGCGWALTIQVMKPIRPGLPSQAFTAVDVAPDNPNNVLAGTAIRKNQPAPKGEGEAAP